MILTFLAKYDTINMVRLGSRKEVRKCLTIEH